MVDPTTIQTAAVVVSALAATGILGLAFAIYRLVKSHERILHGEDSVDDWNGIVPMVERNHERSKANREAIERLKRVCKDEQYP